jgi:hypothetical protein
MTSGLSKGIKGDLERSSRSLELPWDNGYTTDQTKERGDRLENGDLGQYTTYQSIDRADFPLSKEQMVGSMVELG